MKRVALRLLLFLLLGAIINVAVAWYAISYASPSTSLFAAEVMASITKGPGHRSAQSPYQKWEDASFGLRRWSEPGKNPARELTVTVAAGWPMLSFHCWSIWDGQQKTSSCEWNIDIADRRKRTFGWAEKEFPLMPRTPGFAINTIFYAAIVWGLFAVPGYIKRIVGGRRIKRGLCVKCAYPLGASGVCSECGATLHRPPGGGGPVVKKRLAAERRTT